MRDYHSSPILNLYLFTYLLLGKKVTVLEYGGIEAGKPFKSVEVFHK